ncbi:MAG: hypothetical protein RLZ68_192 [Pseudomonadota bacterium]|jgi:hypothetical protein
MLIIFGQQKVELNFLSFLSWGASKIAENFREAVLRGQLKCMEIAKETGSAKSLLTETLKVMP